MLSMVRRSSERAMREFLKANGSASTHQARDGIPAQRLCVHMQASQGAQPYLRLVARRIWFQVVIKSQVLEASFALMR